MVILKLEVNPITYFLILDPMMFYLLIKAVIIKTAKTKTNTNILINIDFLKKDNQ
jgi:hypothetical protein